MNIKAKDWCVEHRRWVEAPRQKWLSLDCGCVFNAVRDYGGTHRADMDKPWTASYVPCGYLAMPVHEQRAYDDRMEADRAWTEITLPTSQAITKWANQMFQYHHSQTGGQHGNAT